MKLWKIKGAMRRWWHEHGVVRLSVCRATAYSASRAAREESRKELADEHAALRETLGKFARIEYRRQPLPPGESDRVRIELTIDSMMFMMSLGPEKERIADWIAEHVRHELYSVHVLERCHNQGTRDASRRYGDPR